MAKVPGISLSEAMVGRGCAAVVDCETVIDGRHPVIMRFYALPEKAEAQASEFISRLPGALEGRYGLDVSVFCGDCFSYHSPEADCQSPDTDA